MNDNDGPPSNRDGGHDILFWSAVLMDLRAERNPHRDSLVRGLRGTEPVPREVRDWLANYLESDRALKPKGAQRHNALERKFIGDAVRAKYEMYLEMVRDERTAERAEAKLSGRKRSQTKAETPTDEAVERTRRDLATPTYKVRGEKVPGDNMSFETIRAIIKRRPPWDG